MTLLHRTRDLPESIESPHVTIFADRCAGCQECVIRCPLGALTMNLDSWIAVADDDRCVGCRQCERTCPFGAITVDGPLMVAPRVQLSHESPRNLARNLDETRHGITTWAAALVEADRCLNCPDPTCVRGCPAHNDIPAFITAVREGDLDEAHGVIGRTSFLPDVCSRVCDQALQCEGACTWSLAGGEPVAIGAIERFICDNAPVPAVAPIDDRGHDLHIAIVGAGPAGIGAAYELVRHGATVTVFDKENVTGGLLHAGIPNFTLPRAVADRPWQQLIASGVKFIGGTQVTLEMIEDLRHQHDALLIATGAGSAIRLPVEGSDLEGVVDAVTFLASASAALEGSQSFDLFGPTSAEDPRRSVTVLVLGAGNTAMDVARLARRLGARAICIDWMDEHFAPVRPDELDEARREGVDIRFGQTLTRLEGRDGRLVRAILNGTHQRRANTLPEIDGDKITTEEVDLVVMAMGYRIDPALGGIAPVKPITRSSPEILDRRLQASGLPAAGAPAFARHRQIGELSLVREIGRLSAALGSVDRVYVAGDALIGPSSVVEAMAQGRRAAEAILDHCSTATSTTDRVGPARILIAFDGNGGPTERAAKQLTALCTHAGAQVVTERVRDLSLDQIASSDLVVIGTQTPHFGAVVGGTGRAIRRAIAALPALGATRVATFCTYRTTSRDTLEGLRRLLEAKGAHIVGERTFGRAIDSRDALASFALEIMDLLESDPVASRLVERLVDLGERCSPLDGALEAATLVEGHRSLLAMARDQLGQRLDLAPGDIALERALHIVDLAIGGTARAEANRRVSQS